jgi:hypothetical protein
MSDPNEALSKAALEIAQRTTPRKAAPIGDTLEAKIARASIDVGEFLPDRDNQGKYTYISADQIMRRCGDALAREGVVIFTEVSNLELSFVEKAKTPFHVAKINLEILISAGGEEHRAISWQSVGVDYTTPDKALAKAITTGVKYFLMKLLSIGIGNEDGEHEQRSDDSQGSAKREEDSLATTARTIKSESQFYEACEKIFGVDRRGVVEALDGMKPGAWQKAQKGRTVREALQRVLDASIAERESEIA